MERGRKRPSYPAAMTAPDLPVPRSSSARYWPEIDLLRAIAGVLMIANHAAVTWLAESQSRGGAVSFVGSLAPVFFFTVTGLGRGIQAATGRARNPLSDSLRKGLVLFIADAALWLSPDQHFGLDFLGFIGLSTVVLEILDRTRRPVSTIAVTTMTCLALRFVLAPRLGLPPGGGAFNQALHFVLGDASVAGVSYPLCPWLAYPLSGWLVGRFAGARADRVRASRGRSALILAGLATGGLALCVVMSRRHMIFFRWGTLSFAYCVLGFSVVIGGMALALAAVQFLPAALIRILGLPGIASFVLVPIHYELIGVIRPLVMDQGGSVFPLALLALAPVAMALSKWIDRRLQALTSVTRRQPIAAFLLFVTLALLFAKLGTRNLEAQDLLRLTAQLLATSLFVLSSRTRAHTANSGA
jgi:Heparan-alpha-glucosaminide N-acetyltransferase, catalytic